MRKIIMQNFFATCRQAANEGESIDFEEFFDEYNKDYGITYDDIEEQFNSFVHDYEYDEKELRALAKKFSDSAAEESQMIRAISLGTRLGMLETIAIAMVALVAVTLFVGENFFWPILMFCLLVSFFLGRFFLKSIENELDETSLHGDRAKACRFASMLIDAYLELDPFDLTSSKQELLYLPAVRP